MMSLKKTLTNLGLNALSVVSPPIGGMAANAIRGVFDLPKDAPERDIEKAINNATPEQIAALKKADQEFEIKMRELDIDVYEIDNADTRDARRFAKDTGLGSVNHLAIFNACLVILISTGVGILAYFGKLAAMTAIESAILTLVVREAFGKHEQVCNFFFGSSHGSKQKTEAIGKKNA